MIERQKGLLKLISSPFCRELFKNREVESLKNIITVALSVTVMSIVYLPKFSAPPVKIGVLWGGRCQPKYGLPPQFQADKTRL